MEKEVLKNDALSSWLRSALRLALEIDPVQAANDAQYLACILQERALRAQAVACRSGDRHASSGMS